MWRRFCNWLLYKRMGWTAEVAEPHPDKYIICLAPHTSNWDFLIGQLYVRARGMQSHFLMKKEWFFWPLGPIFRRMGGIPVYRQKKTSMTDAMAQTALQADTFHLCITPEGTRSRTEEWKKGFYFIALKAQLPILLYGIDYERRHIQCTKTIHPTGDLQADMREIKLYFKDFKGKKPENFTIGNLSMLLVPLLAFALTALHPLSTYAGHYPEHKGKAWVTNASRPYDISHGLDGRHLSVWASHGRYYDQNTFQWEWQRPPLFCTNEDLFTQTIVVPFLMPMLENAGAMVFTPRERDWQRHEVIVDNDQTLSLVSYQEQSYRHRWQTAPRHGFALHGGTYHDGENPFEAGTARMVEATRSKSKLCTASYQPNLPEAGRYAVYVSYQTVDGSVDDAHYTVWHKGEQTEFHVNQRMGGSTWVYLGTFDFDRGSNPYNRVVLSNQSGSHGIVTTDAVRFGGGMGNIERGGNTSGMPRCLEGARYYAQWAGMPYNIYSSKEGSNDYGDDINVRSLMTNYLCKGSVFAPNESGLGVPIELSLGVHSDAGHTSTGRDIYGTLTICTTQRGDSLLGAGQSRNLSRNLADRLLANTVSDLKKTFGAWTMREVYDRNYSETRMPMVPSAIIETLSHQNFGDMRYAQDPNFRFTLARSIYKTLLRFVCDQHQRQAVVTPLAPHAFRITMEGKRGDVRLAWEPTEDPLEPTAHAKEFIIYTAQGSGGYDNGTVVSGTEHVMRLKPGVLYSFRVCAVNKGGRSFPTQTLSALYTSKSRKTVLVVDGFHRLSSPAISGQGFRLDIDPGVSYGRTAGWLGQQQVFDPSRMDVTGPTGHGYSTDELAGYFIAGNDFNGVRTHAEAIQQAKHYNVVSCSSDAIMKMPLDKMGMVDLMLGLERDDGYSLLPYKALTYDLRVALRICRELGLSILVSGAYVGSDARTAEERAFLEQVLHCHYYGLNQSASTGIQGMGHAFDYIGRLNDRHYAATRTDILQPADNLAYCTMTYADRTSAAVAYRGNDYRCMTMGFPFECINGKAQQNTIMQRILDLLLQ